MDELIILISTTNIKATKNGILSLYRKELKIDINYLFPYKNFLINWLDFNLIIKTTTYG
jgi:hypothetical protein